VLKQIERTRTECVSPSPEFLRSVDTMSLPAAITVEFRSRIPPTNTKLSENVRDSGLSSIPHDRHNLTHRLKPTCRCVQKKSDNWSSRRRAVNGRFCRYGSWRRAREATVHTAELEDASCGLAMKDRRKPQSQRSQSARVPPRKHRVWIISVARRPMVCDACHHPMTVPSPHEIPGAFCEQKRCMLWNRGLRKKPPGWFRSVCRGLNRIAFRTSVVLNIELKSRSQPGC
jgi:hypothetical protein